MGLLRKNTSFSRKRFPSQKLVCNSINYIIKTILSDTDTCEEHDAAKYRHIILDERWLSYGTFCGRV